MSIKEYDYYKVHSNNKRGWETVRVKKGSFFCIWCGKSNCKHKEGGGKKWGVSSNNRLCRTIRYPLATGDVGLNPTALHQ